MLSVAKKFSSPTRRADQNQQFRTNPNSSVRLRALRVSVASVLNSRFFTTALAPVQKPFPIQSRARKAHSNLPRAARPAKRLHAFTHAAVAVITRPRFSAEGSVFVLSSYRCPAGWRAPHFSFSTERFFGAHATNFTIICTCTNHSCNSHRISTSILRDLKLLTINTCRKSVGAPVAQVVPLMASAVAHSNSGQRDDLRPLLCVLPATADVRIRCPRLPCIWRAPCDSQQSIPGTRELTYAE